MSAIDELKETMARLRSPELLDTIDRMDMDHMREELGDVLLQVIFHAQMAEEAGHFSFEDVAAEINEKLVRQRIPAPPAGNQGLRDLA